MRNHDGAARGVRADRIAAVLLASLGAALLAAPASAIAAVPPTATVSVSVGIDDGVSAADLPGAVVELRDPMTEEVLGEQVADQQGGVVFADVPYDAADGSVYMVAASWPGAPGGLEDTTALQEFRVEGADAETAVMFFGTYATVSGRIGATVDGVPLGSLDGAGLRVLSQGAVVQELALAADGAFDSAALPTDDAPDYRLVLTPPAGYTLADETDEGLDFALPGGAATVLERSVALVPIETGPTAPTSAPTTAPTSTAPAVDPTLPSTGGSGVSGPVIATGDAGAQTSFVDALGGIDETDLGSVLDAMDSVGAGGSVVLSGTQGQVLGILTSPTEAAAKATGSLVTQLAGGAGSGPGAAPSSAPSTAATVTVGSVSLVGMDIEAALRAVQAQRAEMLDTQLEAKLAQVQSANTRIGVLSDALRALDAYLAAAAGPVDGRTAAFETARALLGPIAPEARLLTAPEAERVAAAEELRTSLKSELDGLSNSQQMDALRLQTLADKRNDAFDLMTSFVKQMQDSRASIIGSLRSAPVAVGVVQWDRGAVTGAFDLSGVDDGAHHLILGIPELGMVVVAEVEVHRDALAATGAGAAPVAGIGLGLLALGVATGLVAVARRRGGRTA